MLFSIKKNKIGLSDSANLDGFGRLRVSNPKTLLDFKQTTDSLPLFFDDQEISGSGTSSTYQTNKATTRLAVSGSTAGKRARQSKMWGNYQPGKSQLIYITFGNLEALSGNTKMVGYFWDNWGIYVKNIGGNTYLGIRTYNTGSAVDNDILQTSWNLDKMDGIGKSGVNLDFTKTQILFIDFERLAVGRVRVGFVVDGMIYYCHEFVHANILTEVYMSNPNAPIRYEIENDGTGAVDYLDCICSSIQSEGGQEATALTSYVSTDGSPITLANEDLFTPIISVRQKSNKRCTRVVPIDLSILATSTTNYEYALFLNPTIAGTDAASRVGVTNSAIEYDISRNNTNTLSGGLKIAGGYGSSTNQGKGIAGDIKQSFLTIGSNIDGSVDEIVLGVKNIDGNGGTVYGGITLSEYC